MLKRCPRCCAWTCGWRLKTCLVSKQAPFGVCGLLALPNIHQIFGGSPAEYPRLVCVMKRGFPPPEGRMWRVCYRRRRRSCSVADRTLGNSVGAIESVACSVGALCTGEASDWGRFGGSLLGIYSAPLGVVPMRFGAWV